MDILYISSLCSNSKFRDLFENATIKPVQQAQKYHLLMVEGLAQNEGTYITVLSSKPVNRSISAQFYYRNEKEEVNGIEYRYLAFINWPILRQIFLFFACFFFALKWLLKKKEGIVICDVLNISIASAAILASMITRTRSVGIVTDVPVFFARMSRDKISLINKVVMTINTLIMNRFKAYVFLTQYMNELINKKQKPYIVIEGQVDIKMSKVINDLDGKYEKKICMYTGALQRIYGIKLLTDAFVAAEVNNTELHIYGSGDFGEELREICKECPSIKYFGVVSNDVVIQEQIKAILLVNPRPTTEEYTKYSFPSKNMEYMVSGTATLTSNLPGMPTDYQQYVYLIEYETVAGLTDTLKDILSKTKEELHHKGLAAKKYVLENKNNVIQAGKVIAMLRKE
ncbi:MAG: glycosyltransferase [Desulfitobacteriaceae bacterium]